MFTSHTSFVFPPFFPIIAFYEPKSSNLGSIWAVGLPVYPPVHLPSLACTRAPRKPRPFLHQSRLFRPVARHLLPVPAARDRLSIQATPVVTHRDNPIVIYRFLCHPTVLTEALCF